MIPTSEASLPEVPLPGSSRDIPLVYRPDLPAGELIAELGTLRRQRLVIERLVCRYLADLVDRIAPCPGGPACDGYPTCDGYPAVDGGAALDGYPSCNGCMDVFEVGERLLGFGTRATRERVRVGRALRRLPRIEQALQSGEMSFARVREVTRVARPETETTWMELGKRLPIRELERRVAEAGGRRAERAAERPANPAPVPDHLRVVLDLSIDDWIMMQKALQTVRDAATRVLTDAEAVVALCHESLATEQAASRPVAATSDPATHDPVGKDDGPSLHDLAGSRPDGPNPHDPVGSRPDAARSDGPSPHDPAGSRADAARSDGPSPRAPAGSRSVAPSLNDPVAARLDAPSPHDPAGSRPPSERGGNGGEPDGDAEYVDPTPRYAAMVLLHLPQRPRWCADDICDASGLSAHVVSVGLLDLELKGYVRRVSWGYYATCGDSPGG